jgi:hypothetical protein
VRTTVTRPSAIAESRNGTFTSCGGNSTVASALTSTGVRNSTPIASTTGERCVSALAFIVTRA